MITCVVNRLDKLNAILFYFAITLNTAPPGRAGRLTLAEEPMNHIFAMAKVSGWYVCVLPRAPTRNDISGGQIVGFANS